MTGTIHVVDDDPSFRTALGRLLRACGYEVELYESGEKLLQLASNLGDRSCILLDVGIPGLSGPDVQANLNAIGSATPVVFITGQGDVPTTVRIMKAGAEDVLTKPFRKDELLNAIKRALERGEAARSERARVQAIEQLVSRLTPRERQVFDRVAAGKPNKQIARELGTTERTVKAHRQNLAEKLGTRSVLELAHIAQQLGGKGP